MSNLLGAFVRAEKCRWSSFHPGSNTTKRRRTVANSSFRSLRNLSAKRLKFLCAPPRMSSLNGNCE